MEKVLCLKTVLFHIRLKARNFQPGKTLMGFSKLGKKPVHSLLWHMRAEVLSPTFNPHLENFLHRQNGYIISKKYIFRAPKAGSEDSFMKSSLLWTVMTWPSWSCWIIVITFPTPYDLFLALFADMWNLWESSCPSHPAAIHEISSLIFFLVTPDWSFISLKVCSGIQCKCQMIVKILSYNSGQTNSHNLRIF